MASESSHDDYQSHPTPSQMPFVASAVAKAVDLIDGPKK
jgi:hypothetical protein